MITKINAYKIKYKPMSRYFYETIITSYIEKEKKITCFYY